jgi:hypothetical protein
MSELMVVWCESSTVQIDSCVIFVECYGVCFRMCFIRLVKVRRMIWVGHITCMRNREEVIKLFIEETWKEETPCKMWVYNIESYLKEVTCANVDWIHLVYWQVLVLVIIILQVTEKAGNFWTAEQLPVSQEWLWFVA